MRSTLVAAFTLSLSVTAFAEAPKQTHHCKMPDGTMDTAKTKKECKTAKGKWVKDAAAGDQAAKPADAAGKPAEAPAKP